MNEAVVMMVANSVYPRLEARRRRRAYLQPSRQASRQAASGLKEGSSVGKERCSEIKARNARVFVHASTAPTGA